MPTVFTPSPVSKAVAFPRTEFGEGDGSGSVGARTGWVEAVGSDTRWQTAGAFPTTVSTSLPQSAVGDLVDAANDLIEDAAESDGGTVASVNIGSTGQQIEQTSPGSYSWGVYGALTLGQLTHIRDVAVAIRDMMA